MERRSKMWHRTPTSSQTLANASLPSSTFPLACLRSLSITENASGNPRQFSNFHTDIALHEIPAAQG
jgi:hypothetical protein